MASPDRTGDGEVVSVDDVLVDGGEGGATEVDAALSAVLVADPAPPHAETTSRVVASSSAAVVPPVVLTGPARRWPGTPRPGRPG